jgi:hypothetical protein
MVECLEPATLKASSYGNRRPLHCTIDRVWERRVAFLYHDARKSTEHDLDLADLVPTAFGSVGVGQANCNPFD